MSTGLVTEQDVEDVRAGKTKFLPRPNGGWVRLAYHRGGIRLTLFGERGTLEGGKTPGGGAVPETAHPVSE